MVNFYIQNVLCLCCCHFLIVTSDRGSSFSPFFLLLPVTAPKIQIHSNFDGCHLKILFLHIICQVFLAVLLCKILESRWVFKSVHRYNVLIFHSSSPGESVRALTVLIDVWHVNSGSPLSFPVCSNKIKSGRFNEILWAFLIKKLFYSCLLDMRWLY